MKCAIQALSLATAAVICARTDEKHRREHLEAALSATGDLQRELIRERLKLDATSGAALSANNRGSKP